MRYATLKDHAFIYSLVLEEAANGHFSRDLLSPAATRGLDVELRSVLAERRRHNGAFAYALIHERLGQPIGFLAISALDGNNGNELWLAAVSPEHRGKGECREMVNALLHQFRKHGAGLLARCAPESEAMFHILTSSGDLERLGGAKGYRSCRPDQPDFCAGP